jgi:hypothetical protein
MSEKVTSQNTTRREILKKAAFVAPTIITLAATPSFASAGSRDHEPRERDHDRHEKKHHRPRGGDD